VGWLDQLVGWLKDALAWLFAGFLGLVKGFLMAVVHMVLDGFLYLVSLIPVPDFLAHNSIGSMLGSAGPVIGWLGSSLDFGSAMALIAAGYAFRLLRKLFTLGQW
jgi:hypothetical protein